MVDTQRLENTKAGAFFSSRKLATLAPVVAYLRTTALPLHLTLDSSSLIFHTASSDYVLTRETVYILPNPHLLRNYSDYTGNCYFIYLILLEVVKVDCLSENL